MSAISNLRNIRFYDGCHNYCCFSGDDTLLTSLLNQGDYEGIIGSQELFFTLYCKTWLKHQNHMGIRHEWQVCKENGKIDLYYDGTGKYNVVARAIETLRQRFLKARESRVEEIYVVTDYLSFFDTSFILVEAMDIYSPKHEWPFKGHKSDIIESSFVVDYRQYYDSIPSDWYINYIHPVLPKLAQSCGFTTKISEVYKQNVGYVLQCKYYETLHLRKVMAQQVIISKVEQKSVPVYSETMRV